MAAIAVAILDVRLLLAEPVDAVDQAFPPAFAGKLEADRGAAGAQLPVLIPFLRI